MIAGHAPLAFAIAGSVATAVGVSRRRALAIGFAAAGFAILPDVDVVYAVVGVLGATPTDVWSANEAFWTHSKAVHRGITHSLVLAGPAVAAFGLAAGGRRHRLGTAVVLAGLLGLGVSAAGAVGFVMTALYLLAGLALVAALVRFDLSTRETFAAAAVGLFSHPFGDLFTGSPPQFFYPLGPDPVNERIALLGEPTLNLLSVFGLELASIWLGLLVGARLLEVSLWDYLDPVAMAGTGYGLAALVLPAPTMEVSYHFVFSVLAVGGVGVRSLRGRVTAFRVARAFVTGIAAVTLGGLAYTVGYLLV